VPVKNCLPVLDNAEKQIIIPLKSEYSLIKSGGGNGPMKPGNLLFKVLNPAATKDEDSAGAHIESSVCVFYV
jgi:hypothetical protein